MLTLTLAILAASVLGSLHCAGMCGAFLAIALGSGNRVHTQLAYHGGRLLTYVTLGTAAGALGHALDLAGTLAGLQPVATALAGLTIIAFGLVSYARIKGFAIPIRPPAFMIALSSRGHRFAMSKDVVTRAALIGLFTTLLPCGWLYAFVATAAGTAHPLKGALAMAAFWVGTLPLMVALGAGLREGLGALGRRVPAITCLALVALGLYTLTGRLALAPQGLLAKADAAATSSDITPSTPEIHVPSPSTLPACCAGKDRP